MVTRAVKMALSCPLGIVRTVNPHNKFVIGQASAEACLARSINTQKKELGQYSAILTKQAWPITHNMPTVTGVVIDYNTLMVT